MPEGLSTRAARLRHALLHVLTLAAAASFAQAPDPAAALAAKPPSVPLPPIIDPARELKGKALVAALRKGGFVLYMRHAQTGVVSPDNACAPDAITPLDAEQAKKVGVSLRFLKIPVGELRYKRWATVPPAGVNTVLVSHVHGGNLREQWVQIEIAELAVFRPDGKGGTEPVARIALENWAALIAADRM